MPIHYETDDEHIVLITIDRPPATRPIFSGADLKLYIPQITALGKRMRHEGRHEGPAAGLEDL
jgi:hypothetical protein